MKAGWEIKTFENVLEIKNGRNQKAVQKENGQYPIYGSAGNVMGLTDDYICEAGTTIIGRKGTINNPIYTETKFWNVDTAFGLSPKEFLDSKFLHYFCISYDFSEHNRGTTIPSLVKTDLLQIQIPLPPLPEQKRLVTLLDEAFESIATAKANAQQNLKNARALFESHLNEVFTKRGEGWEEKTIGSIAEIKGGKRVPKGYKLLSEPTDYLYLRVADFTDEGSIDMSNLRYIDAEVHRQIKNYIIYSSDLYISIAGTIGKTGIIPEELNGSNLTENACRLVFKSGIHNRFIYYFTLTTNFIEQVGLNTRTSAQPKLALSRLSTIELGIPSITEQKRLAMQFDTIIEETQRLEALYSRKIAALDELKKALLHRAFAGEL